MILERPTDLMIHIGGGFYVNLDQNVDPFHWMFALTGDGVPYTLRQATGHEVNLATTLLRNREAAKATPNGEGLTRLYRLSHGGIMPGHQIDLVAAGQGGASVVELQTQLEQLRQALVKSHDLLLHARRELTRQPVPGTKDLAEEIRVHLNTIYTMAGMK